MTYTPLTNRRTRPVALLVAAVIALTAAACTSGGAPTVGDAAETQAPSRLESVDSISALVS